MEDLSTILSANFGIHRVGKSAPMSAAKSSSSSASATAVAPTQTSWERETVGDYNHNHNHNHNSFDYDDIFGGPPAYGRSASVPSPSIDSLFDGFIGNPANESLFDGFNGGPAPAANFDELFPTTQMDSLDGDGYLDILGNLGRTAVRNPIGFDNDAVELIPGFGGIKRQAPDTGGEDDPWLTAFDVPRTKIAPPPPSGTTIARPIGSRVARPPSNGGAIARPRTLRAPAASQLDARARAAAEAEERTKQRMADALGDKIERDMEAQREEEERKRITDVLDLQIKRWAAGKEGNLRALLSSLQDVLWPECGWKAVSLVDLITTVSVKKVYRNATLCLHPDKVQQKGADLKQKCIAAKVFDLLKEAWNKFNSEEMQRG